MKKVPGKIFKEKKVRRPTNRELEILLKNYYLFLRPERFNLLNDAQKDFIRMVVIGIINLTGFKNLSGFS